MKIIPPTNDEFERFVHPWKFDNELGVLEVDADDIEIGKFIGCGGKASTKMAKWQGKEIALKCVDPDDPRSPPYSQWELERYCDMKDVQGSLIPKLYFASRDKERGTRMFGLELGKAVHDDENIHDDLRQTNAKIIKTGWKQRPCSWRRDNVVWMTNEEDGDKRLVAIDLESFIPSFSPDAPLPSLVDRKTIFGLPIINPTELKMQHNHSDWSWKFFDSTSCPGVFRGEQEVSVVSYGYKYSETDDFRTTMTRYLALRELPETEAIIAKPLFVCLERNGDVYVGYDRFVSDETDSDEMEKGKGQLRKSLRTLGWDTPFYWRWASPSFVWANVDGKKCYVAVDLSCLKAIDPPTDPESMDESESASGSTKSGGDTTTMDPAESG